MTEEFRLYRRCPLSNDWEDISFLDPNDIGSLTFYRDYLKSDEPPSDWDLSVWAVDKKTGAGRILESLFAFVNSIGAVNCGMV